MSGGGMISSGSPLSKRRVGPCLPPFTISGAPEMTRSCASMEALCSPNTIDSFLSESSPFALYQTRSWGDLMGNPRDAMASGDGLCSRYFLIEKSYHSGSSESVEKSEASRNGSNEDKEYRESSDSVSSRCFTTPKLNRFMASEELQSKPDIREVPIETVELGLPSDQPNVHLTKDQNTPNYGTISGLILAPRAQANGLRVDQKTSKPFLSSTMRQSSTPFLIPQKISSPQSLLRAENRQPSICSLNIPRETKTFVTSKTSQDCRGFLGVKSRRASLQGSSLLRVPGVSQSQDGRKGSFLSAFNSSIMDKISLASRKSSILDDTRSISRSEEVKNKIIQNFNTVRFSLLYYVE